VRDETIDERPRHEQSLRYLKANDVKGPLRSFEGLEVLDREHQTIGRLDGIIIDPQERRVRYLVVDERKFVRRHRVLLPLETARVDAARAALHVDVDKADVDDMEEFDTCTFPPFSDDDLITALFAR
jgi:sporulation protein YlmC with PRC-barrel domain